MNKRNEVDSVESKSGVTELQIGNTLFIVEYETSDTATETAYDKVKRLITSHATDHEKLSEITQLSA